MAFQYCYAIYDYHYAADQQERLDQMVADGWQIFSAAPGSLELQVVWQRELPAASKPDPRSSQKHRENLSSAVSNPDPPADA
jgi:hypothetical protein